MRKVRRFLLVSVIVSLGLCTNVLAQEKTNDKTASSKKATRAENNNGPGSQVQLSGNGLMGYISSKAPQPATGFGAGIGFYVSVYPILPEPIDNFQIGLASTWIVPKNADNKDQPLCPPGSYARDNWPERAPRYGEVFQTIEGGLGIWGSTQFRAGYKPPKFQIVGVPDCYTGNYLISPGWSNTTTAAADDKMGIAQLSNHFLLPPDGLTFQNSPKGELFGYSWMSLPLMDVKPGPPPTGNQHWTLFLALSNFKGPVAFVIPESWSKISKDFVFDYGRGLDAQEGYAGGGAQEFNTVPYFEAKDENGTVFSKVPNFIYPVDGNGKTVLMQDIRSWGTPGPAKGPFYANLADGSRVTYYWYRFIDQPSLQQYKKVWSESQKAEMQSVVEKIQKNWTANKEYMPAPRDGKPLVSIDPGLLVTPPKGLEIGYVPIVTSQEAAKQ